MYVHMYYVLGYIVSYLTILKERKKFYMYMYMYMYSTLSYVQYYNE